VLARQAGVFLIEALEAEAEAERLPVFDEQLAGSFDFSFGGNGKDDDLLLWCGCGVERLCFRNQGCTFQGMLHSMTAGSETHHNFARHEGGDGAKREEEDAVRRHEKRIVYWRLNIVYCGSSPSSTCQSSVWTQRFAMVRLGRTPSLTMTNQI